MEMPPSLPSRALVRGSLKRIPLPPAVIVTALSLAAVAGIAAAIPGPWTFLMAGSIVALLLATLVPAAPTRTTSRSGSLAVEVPVLALLASGLVFRVRGTEEILDNPLDTAGLFRVAFLALALFLAAIGFMNGRQSGIRSRPFRLYALYAATALIGAAGSADPLLTIFHVGELLIALFVFVAAVRSAGPEAPFRIEATLYWFQVTLMGTVWLSVILFPGQAIIPVNSPIPWQIQGVVPAVASNGVGTLGAILTLWSLARFLSPVAERSSPRLSLGIAAAGFVTLVAASTGQATWRLLWASSFSLRCGDERFSRLSSSLRWLDSSSLDMGSPKRRSRSCSEARRRRRHPSSRAVWIGGGSLSPSGRNLLWSDEGSLPQPASRFWARSEGRRPPRSTAPGSRRWSEPGWWGSLSWRRPSLSC